MAFVVASDRWRRSDRPKPSTVSVSSSLVGIRHGDNNLQGFEVVKRCLHWLR